MDARGISGNDLTRAHAKRAMLILQPITGWHSIYGVAQHGIDIRIDLVRQIWRRMFQQPLYDSRGSTILRRDRAKGLS